MTDDTRKTGPAEPGWERPLAAFFAEGAPIRAVLSMPARKDADCPRLAIRQLDRGGYQAERQVGKQAFHQNLRGVDECQRLIREALRDEFRQLNAWNEAGELCVSVAPDGRATCKRKRRRAGDAPAPEPHNRERRRPLREGEAIPPLVEMGVFTPEGRLVPAMADKYRQICRFVELVADVVGEGPRDGRPFRAVDFGCGKSYLTFIVYHYLTVVRGLSVEMTGLDLKADVIAHCNEAARRFGYGGLHFETGNVSGYAMATPADLVMTLHACDTATDYALAHAVRCGAGNILSVPCCQHELNGQMHSDELAALCRYGIIQERVAALLTDTIRAHVLTACGYRTQVLEFVDLSHTPKNLLLRAVRSSVSESVRERAVSEVRALMGAFHVRLTIVRLLLDGQVSESAAGGADV